MKVENRKLALRFVGPFKVVRRVNPTFHVSRLRPVVTSPLLPKPKPTPPPRVTEGQTTYTVNRLLDSRRAWGCLQYLVVWEGYGPGELSWIPAQNIVDQTLIRDFHQSHPDRPKGGSCQAQGTFCRNYCHLPLDVLICTSLYFFC